MRCPVLEIGRNSVTLDDAEDEGVKKIFHRNFLMLGQ